MTITKAHAKNEDGKKSVKFEEWSKIPWKKIERRIFKLQKHIYKASSCGNTKTVRKLQKLLMKSYYARAIAVRKVTQRVNLFDKVLIPRARKHIERIRIHLSDAERAAVVRSKIAKGKRLKQGLA